MNTAKTARTRSVGTKLTEAEYAQVESAAARGGRTDAWDALQRIVPNPDAFKSLPPEAEIEIGCAVFVHSEEWPYLGLSSKLISRMAAIGASFDLDLYPPA